MTQLRIIALIWGLIGGLIAGPLLINNYAEAGLKGFSVPWASPPAIGGTTPAAITGTTVTATTAFRAADGSATTPTYSWTGATGDGLYNTGGNAIRVALAGAQAFLLTAGDLSILNNAGRLSLGSSQDAALGRAAANSIVYGAASVVAGSATSRTEINKAITGFTDAAAKTVFTIAIPAASHSASVQVRCTGTLGAGGAVGANEASATNSYVVTVTKVTGVAAVAAISSAFGAAASNVAGAATVTAVATLAAVAGGTGANTVDVQLTITKSGGSSDNHTAVCTASLLNANATGVTIS